MKILTKLLGLGLVATASFGAGLYLFDNSLQSRKPRNKGNGIENIINHSELKSKKNYDVDDSERLSEVCSREIQIGNLHLGNEDYNLGSEYDLERIIQIVRNYEDFNDDGERINESDIEELLNYDPNSPESIVSNLNIYLRKGNFKPFESSRLLRLLMYDVSDGGLKKTYKNLIDEIEGFYPEEINFNENGYVDFGRRTIRDYGNLKLATRFDSLVTLKFGNLESGEDLFPKLNGIEYNFFNENLSKCLEQLNYCDDKLYKSERLELVGKLVADKNAKYDLFDSINIRDYSQDAVKYYTGCAKFLIDKKKSGEPISKIFKKEVINSLKSYLKISETLSRPLEGVEETYAFLNELIN